MAPTIFFGTGVKLCSGPMNGRKFPPKLPQSASPGVVRLPLQVLLSNWRRYIILYLPELISPHTVDISVII